MKLVALVDEMPVFSEEARTIKAFNDIIRRDRGSEGDSQGRKKQVAIAELGFIYFYCSFDSRFDLYDTDIERIEAIRITVGLPDTWQVDNIIKEAIKVYTDLMKTESMRLVNKARGAIKKYEDYLESVDLDERTKNDGLVHDAKKYRENVNGVAEMIENLNKAKKLVEKEIEDKIGSGNGKKRDRSLIEDETFGEIDPEWQI